ncbi:MAG: hypothetical protein ACYDDA_12630 [Acidiferrobacteraceae bacterium]
MNRDALQFCYDRFSRHLLNPMQMAKAQAAMCSETGMVSPCLKDKRKWRSLMVVSLAVTSPLMGIKSVSPRLEYNRLSQGMRLLITQDSSTLFLDTGHVFNLDKRTPFLRVQETVSHFRRVLVSAPDAPGGKVEKAGRTSETLSALDRTDIVVRPETKSQALARWVLDPPEAPYLLILNFEKSYGGLLENMMLGRTSSRLVVMDGPECKVFYRDPVRRVIDAVISLDDERRAHALVLLDPRAPRTRKAQDALRSAREVLKHDRGPNSLRRVMTCRPHDSATRNLLPEVVAQVTTGFTTTLS